MGVCHHVNSRVSNFIQFKVQAFCKINLKIRLVSKNDERRSWCTVRMAVPTVFRSFQFLKSNDYSKTECRKCSLIDSLSHNAKLG